ncbi:hypothetical protein ABDK00_016915 [Niabella insulamsoli]|uniref:phage major capsid protein n=1 Tax=Niabella insulamsoli TaxID=3144874 RepID=UPI0031FBCD09
MAGNFPEIWLKRVIRMMEQALKAPWLDGIGEVEGDVIELGAGTETEKNIIHVPLSTFEPEVLVNNTTYPIDAVEYTDDNATLQLNKFQTEVTTLNDDQVMGASYNKIDEATKSHIRAITKKKLGMAIHAMAPASHTAATPVLRTTGEAFGGRKMLIYEDLVALKDAFDKAGIDVEGRRLVLCTDHWNDLLKDRKNFGDQLVNYKKGDLAPNIAGFDIYQYINMPLYTSAGAKKAFGAAPAAGDYAASVAYHESNVGKKTGKTKQYFLAAALNPRNQSNELNYRHYFIVMPFENKAIGAIASDAAA